MKKWLMGLTAALCLTLCLASSANAAGSAALVRAIDLEVSISDARYESGSGMMRFTYAVSGPSRVRTLSVAAWKDGEWTDAQIAATAEKQIARWKNGSPPKPSKTPPFQFPTGFPVDEKYLGKTLDVLLLATDENVDLAGCCIVRVQIPGGASDPTPTVVASGECGAQGGNLTWTLDSDGTLTIGGSGYMADYLTTLPPWYEFGGETKRVVLQEGVASLSSGSLCFQHTTPETLSSVQLPDSLVEIKRGALNNNYLKQVTIPKNVSLIEGGAVMGERLSVSITPENPYYSVRDGAILSKDETVLIQAPNMAAFLPDNQYQYYNYDNVYTVPDTVSEIADGAFRGCYWFSDITLPESVKRIGDYAFAGTGDLGTGSHFVSIKLPNGIETVGAHAFEPNADYTAIANLVREGGACYIGNERDPFLVLLDVQDAEQFTVHEGTRVIAPWAFARCASLSEVAIPKSIVSIGASAFGSCFRLKTVPYSGSRSDWRRIAVGQDNDFLLNADIQFASVGVSEFEKLLQTDPAEYNNELALIAAKLSRKTYDNGGADGESIKGFLTRELGFAEKDVYPFNYGDSNAFSIAKKEYSGNDADGIIIIAIRGTYTSKERWFDDILSCPDISRKNHYSGYTPFEGADGFASQVLSELLKLTESNRNYKILITGHSLGGAAANLLAADLLINRYNTLTPRRENIYCYTFGAINSIDKKTPVVSGFENIHNIYNLMDTFSPYQYGYFLAGGMGEGYGKFGWMECYVHEYRIPIMQTGLFPITQVIQSVNHGMDHYLEAVEAGEVVNSPKRTSPTSVCACPVDVDVYCDGQLVGRVLREEIDTSVTMLDISVEDGVKFITYPDTRQYELRITAYDEGDMEFSTFNASESGQVKSIYGIALTEGKTMTSATGGDIAVSETQLLVVDETGGVLSKVETDGTERAVDPAKLLFSHTEPIRSGDAVYVEAAVENFTDTAEVVCLCAALYDGDRMIAARTFPDVAAPVEREVRRSFAFAVPEKDRNGELSVKLFYLDAKTMTPLAPCAACAVN